jgi:hypothetical protein
MINEKEFYKEQAEKFRDYASKFPERELFSLFEEWAESKDIYGIDKHEIWVIARKTQPFSTITIRENSEEFVRISAVLDILLQNNLARLNKMIERKRKREEKKKNKLDKS